MSSLHFLLAHRPVAVLLSYSLPELSFAIPGFYRPVERLPYTAVVQQYNGTCEGKKKVKVGFLYSATYTANQNSALHNLGRGS